MPCQLPIDCLNEIFEYLEDKADLRSCLLVNRLWCETSVPFLWTNIQNFNTLIACLPNESKEILYKNEILISAPTSKPPLFNYVSFIKNLSMTETGRKIKIILNKYEPIDSVNNKRIVILQEIFKMVMNQISLKKLNLCYCSRYISNVPFTIYPGATDCLRNLSELSCRSLNNYSNFLYQLSQICHKISSLNIIFRDVISNGLADLISVQQNLKHLSIINRNLTDIIPLLTKIPNPSILTKLDINSKVYMPWSFIAKFTNLQELEFSLYHKDHFEDFKNLQHVIFPQLQILKFLNESPNHEDLIKFLEINGKNLIEFYLSNANDSTNLALAKFCPNLKSLI